VNGLENPRVGAATTNVLLKSRSEVSLRQMRVGLQQSDYAHNHPCRAIAALKSTLPKKSLLDRVKLIALSQSFDRQHGMLVSVGDRCQAGGYGFAIKQDRAGAALAFTAAVFCAGEMQLFAQNLKQRPLGIRADGVRLSVDGEGDRGVHTFSWPIVILTQ